MKYIAAYALLVLGGKEPSEADVEKVLKEAGVKADGEKVKKVVAALKGKKFHELVAAGKKKMCSSGAPVAAPAKGGDKPAEKKAEAKKEEPKKEEEADVDMGGLFGGDY